MDSILTGLLNFGIGGMMAAVVAWFLLHLLKVTIPNMAREHHAAMTAQQELFRQTNKEIVMRMEQITTRIEAMDKHLQANQVHYDLFNEYVTRTGGVPRRRKSRGPEAGNPSEGG